MDKKDAIAIIIDLSEKELRRALIAAAFMFYESPSVTLETFEEILDSTRR